ncbi:MAG: SUMF1/EgtB/PvdO family nonheme iron enzyme [Thiohalocapsa sp.]|jgi:formylglycine-generating enzyme required for sulfatase activity/energy-coupling factor transporter ATP-binding protein EcfA2|uniref:nSTAND1 domain-containing NTPase n=1 Tax=Thiohalocapsa sp. TaxID=2497641 RepID=UPI0025F60E4C|nr:SUMF1/EgtB/PvdO family nonheme iron enzyme [Thiohalocapsa sp.]MCG6940810.1 SUMF1/EgtB/PvdO family nonheme iron enzyme [Thiohalocapsa sp.]
MADLPDFDVFLSYNPLDHAAVGHLARALEDRGLKVFLDRWELVPGSAWPEALAGHLAQCRAAAIVLGPHGMGPWQQRERTLALDRQGRNPRFGVIPVLLPNAEPALGFLTLSTWVDLRAGVDDTDALDLLAAAVRGEPPAALLERTRQTAARVCPYRGLEVFREEDAPFFFGREACTEALLRAVAAQSLVAVVGSSGSGKSSLVRAGLVPALRQPDADTIWEVATLLTGARPLHALAGALLPFLEPEAGASDWPEQIEQLAGRLAAGEVTLAAVIERLLARQPGTDRLLLVVDQWEELYTQAGDDDTKARTAGFIDVLLTAADAAPLTVVLTLRADFYNQVLDHRRLADRLQAAQINLGPMNREELAAAVTRPAEQAGLQFEDGLPERLLDDVGDAPGNLSRLQFALEALWAGRRGDRLLHAVYQSTGGIEGAVAQRAETFYGGLDPAGQRAAEQLFTKLVRPGEATGDIGLRTGLGQLDAAEAVLARELADQDCRLLVTARDPVSGRQTVALAHEALIGAWSRLGAWVDQLRQTRKDQRLLDELAGQWREQGKPRRRGLASGRTLKRFAHVGAASELAGEYLRASRAQRKRRRLLVVVAILVVVAAWQGLAWLGARGLTLRHPLAAVLDAAGLWQPIEPEMITISQESGHPMRFVMGLDSSKASWLGPGHEVRIAHAYRIGRDEVTFAEYDRFALATWRKLPDDKGWGRGDRPVINVSWQDAEAYTDWLSGKTGKRYRLPKEAEWEHAARGGTNTAYWWGDDVHEGDSVWADCDGCGSPWDLRQTAPVGSFQANAFGLRDTAGNVWEWVEDCWHGNYAGAPNDGSAWGEPDDADCRQRVMRGGYWGGKPDLLRSAFRFRGNAASRTASVGFRVAQDP